MTMIAIALILVLTMLVPVGIGFSQPADTSLFPTIMSSVNGFGQVSELQYYCQYC